MVTKATYLNKRMEYAFLAVTLPIVQSGIAFSVSRTCINNASDRNKSQPITKKHFAQEYKFLGPTNEHPPFGLCLRPDNDINEALSPWMHVNEYNGM